MMHTNDLDFGRKNSGANGKYGEQIPAGVKGWSWGAFLLNWIWAIGNRTWWGLLAIIPYVGIVVALWLGFKGREMAWKNREWHSVEHFNRVQRSWSKWAFIVLATSLVIGMLASVAAPTYVEIMRRFTNISW